MKKPHIAKLRHRMKLCSQRDVVTENNDMRLNRAEVSSIWCSVEEKAASHFSVKGATVGNRNERTHIICARYNSDLNVSNMAWLYEERRKSSPRWFKILKVGQTEMKGSVFFKFEVRLVERADDIPEPVSEQGATNSPIVGLPEGVNL